MSVAPFSEDIAAGVRAGDPQAVGAVYACMSDRILGYLHARLRDRALAEDLTVQTFIELLQRGSTITGGAAAIKVWLFRAAHFNLLDHVRKAARRGEQLVDDLTVVYDEEDPDPGPFRQAAMSEDRRMVRRAVDHLSDDQREVILLRYVAGLSGPEVAEVTGRSAGAVRSLQHRGERALARLLERDPSAPAPDRAAGASQPTTGP